MPVRFDTYDAPAGELDLSEGTAAHRVLSLLAADPDVGYMAEEIHAATDIPRERVWLALQQLDAHGLVRRKGPYWASARDDRLAAAAAQHASLASISERFGDDYYAETPEWHADLPDLDAEGEG